MPAQPTAHKLLTWLSAAYHQQSHHNLTNQQLRNYQARHLYDLIANNCYLTKQKNNIFDYSLFFLTQTNFAQPTPTNIPSHHSNLPTRDYGSAVGLTLLNGKLQPNLNMLPDLPPQVVICDLAQAINQYPELVIPYLIKDTCGPQDPMLALNTALATEGVLVYLPPNTRLNCALNLCTTAQHQVLTNIRHIIIVSENSHLTLTEEYQASTAQTAYTNNVVLDFMLAKNAHLNYYKLQNEATQAKHFSNICITQKQHSTANIYLANLGSNLSFNTCNVSLQEQFATCKINGCYILPHANQIVGNKITVEHQASNTQSNIDVNGIISNNAHGMFQAKILVQEGTTKVVAHQTNHNILLSNLAEVTSKPELEIYADNVQCRHGATVGNLDENAILYLRSRGINRNDAIIMLLQGFIASTLTNITLPWFQTLVEQEWRTIINS